MSRPPASLALAVVAICFGLHAGAQSTRRELVGRIRDSTGAPVMEASIEVAGLMTRSDSDGRFRLSTPAIDTLRLSVRRMGFAPELVRLKSHNGQWDSVVVELSRNPQLLDPMHTLKDAPLRMREFELRRSRGVGVFVTRQEIAQQNTTVPSDILRNHRGIRVVRLREGGFGVRFVTFSSKPNCQPALWIDGQRARDMEVDEISAGDIEGIELYDSFSITPFEFTRDSSLPCGTIVVWTRVPGK
jgi:hypothetical protein